MAYAHSQKHKTTNNDEINDPILQLIEKIRTEYCNFKKEKNDIITALQKTNLNLTETINNLNDQLNSTFGSPSNCDKKRRKTNSSDESEVDSAKLFGRIKINDSSSNKSLESLFSRPASTDGSSVDGNKGHIKVNSSDDSDLDNSKLIRRINILDSSADKSIGSALNEAINDENIILDDSELMFPPTQKTPIKKRTSPLNKQILSPVNNNIIKKEVKTPMVNLTTPPLMKKLPKRMKSTISSNNENQNPLKKEVGWISSNQINQKTKNNWNMSFVQPVKNTGDSNLNLSGDVIACSQDVILTSMKKDRNKPSLKYSPKLRQAKLEFDLKIERKDSIKSQGNETLCEDIIGASPTCRNSITSKDSKITRTLRKIPRKKSDDLFVFPIKKSLSNECITKGSKSIKPTTSTPSITPTKIQLKIEPKTALKDDDVLLKTKFFEHMLTEDSIEGLLTPRELDDNSRQENNDNTAKKMLDNDSSVFILPSQADDVIFVDDTDQIDYNLSSMDLLAEMLRDDKDTQPLLKRFEAEQIKSLHSTDTNNKKTITPPSTSRLQLPQIKNKPIDNDETKLDEIFDDKNDFTTSFKNPEPAKGFHHDCDECQKFRKYLISQNVPLDEIERRLQTCKKPQRLHLTPDGFWDPCFRNLSANDPRNEVLIDYRFVNKKKEQK